MTEEDIREVMSVYNASVDLCTQENDHLKVQIIELID